MPRTPTKRLDDALRLLRKPAPQPVADRRPVYAAGLAAMNWQRIDTWVSHAPHYWLYEKHGKLIRLYHGDRIEIALAGPCYDFRPVPKKARRNIALAAITAETYLW